MRSMEDQMGEIVEALAGGARVRRRASAWRMGTATIPDDVVDAIRTAGLATLEKGELLLLPAGRHARAAGRRPRVERRLASTADANGRSRAARSVTVALGEAPLGWLRARGLLSQRQFDAGEALHADWTRAQLAPSVTMRWDAAPSGGQPRGPGAALSPGEAQVAARARFDCAIAAVGPGLGDVLWRVACAGEGLEAAERALGWPGRSGKVVLGLALDRLADHYRMPEPASSTSR